MKKQLLSIVVLSVCLLSFRPVADTSALSSREIVWCGFDFSKVKLIGAEGFTDPNQIKNHFFDSWNNLVLNESEKYDIKKFYGKDKQVNDLSVVRERNEMPEVDDLVINDSYSFEEGELEKIIKDYNMKDAKEGLGVVYIVEALNKTEEKAVVHVVFFDIASKEILWTKEYTEKPRGFGFRNYWAGALYKTMDASGDDFQKAAKKGKKG